MTTLSLLKIIVYDRLQSEAMVSNLSKLSNMLVWADVIVQMPTYPLSGISLKLHFLFWNSLKKINHVFKVVLSFFGNSFAFFELGIQVPAIRQSF